MNTTTLSPAEVQRIADGLSVGMEQLLHRIAGAVVDIDGTEVHSARALERRGLAIYSRRERRAYLTTSGLAVLDELAHVAEQGHAILAGAAAALGVDLAGGPAAVPGPLTRWAEVQRERTLADAVAIVTDAGPVGRLVAQLGAKPWTHPTTGQRRWYVDDWHRLIGLEVELYDTGNISHAMFNGEEISNTAARRMGAQTGKVWIDEQGVPHCDYVSAHVAGLIRRTVAEKLAVLQ